jgi:gliding motility-associated-like protein
MSAFYLLVGTNFHPCTYNVHPPMRLVRVILLIFHCLGSIQSLSQSCGDAYNAQLCGDSSPVSDTLIPVPFQFGCMDVSLSYFYSFHTNTVAGGLPVNIALSIDDCDTFIGTDSVYVMLVEVNNNSDPCNPANYGAYSCFADSNATFSTSFTTLNPDQDYLLVLGSNHSSLYGPCELSVSISGDGVDLVASVNPIVIYLGESAQLQVQGADAAPSTVLWSNEEVLDDENSLTPTAFPEATTTFQVSGEVDGCEVTDFITVTIAPPIVVFNAFSPNGDNINETWVLKGIERFPNCQVEVFDRWGQSIFKNVSYAKPWDGTNDGKYLPTGAYYYVIELNSLDVTIAPLTGIVSIIH